MLDMLVRKSASLSVCGNYRYRLTRYWGPGYMLPFVMLNPSTADAEIDDPTIRRCMGFARRENAGGVIVVNLYALRSPSPAKLGQVSDPLGPENFNVLNDMAAAAVETNISIVCAWGSSRWAINGKAKITIHHLQCAGARLVCLGTTKDGHPRHPLYVAGDQSLVPFPTQR